MRAFLRFWTDPARARLRLLLLAATSVICALWSAWIWHRSRTWPESALLPLQDPLANLNQVGVNVDLAQYDAVELDRVLSQVRDAGFRWVRQRFGWEEIEPQRGRLTWDAWDPIVSACAAYDLELIAVLDGSPPWAREGSGSANPYTPPQETADWGTFVARFAGRYRGHVAAYQLWDEPNLSSHWGDRYVAPVGYVALLREGAIRARDADPGAVILLAALAPTVEYGPLNLNEVTFLEQITEAGAGPYYDVVALQPYGFGDPPQARADLGHLNYARIGAVHRKMVRLGLGDRPVWATAWGWNALPAGWEGQPTLWAAVSVEDQAEYTRSAIEQARREWPWMGPMILYTYQPDLPADDPRWGFALLDAQGISQPVHDELRRASAIPPALHTGVYRASPETAQFSGAWRFSSAGADPPPDAGREGTPRAGLAFDFWGTSLDLTVRRGDFWGVFYVRVDGQSVQGLPRDEGGRAYLVLHDPSGQVETIQVARGLSPDTPHRLEIDAHGGWGQWPLVGWTVWGEPLRDLAADVSPIWLLLGVSAGAALAAVGQIALDPGVLLPVLAGVGRVFRRYRALPEWVPVLATLGAVLAFYFVPWAPASLLLLAILFALFFLRIDLGLAAVAFALPFYLRPKMLLGRPFSTVELALGLCALAWLSARLLDLGRAAVRSGPGPLLWRLGQLGASLRTWTVRTWLGLSSLDVGMAALVGLAALSLTWTTHLQVAVREFRTVFVESALFYALLRLALRTLRAHRRVIEGWLLGATAISLIGLGQRVSGQNLITVGGISRVRGFYGSPNNLALYLSRALPVLLAVAWQGRDRVRRLAYGIAALPVLAALVCTQSRGALLLALPAALLALGLLKRSRKATWTALGALAALVLLLLPLVVAGRLFTWFDPSTDTGLFRLRLWRSTLSMLADHPLTGVGLDNYLYAYRSRYVLPSAWGELDLSHPHNLLLDAWTRLGIGGVGIVVWMLVAFFRGAWAQLRTVPGDRRAVLLGLASGMIAALAHGLVDHAIFVIDLAFVFGLLLAMAHPLVRARSAHMGVDT
ncbi:MAG: O-antigen ligase family protein [Anaerolineae bacterium]|nr:O-antigen ligase family protein [Anaerolineae bacterium]